MKRIQYMNENQHTKDQFKVQDCIITLTPVTTPPQSIPVLQANQSIVTPL